MSDQKDTSNMVTVYPNPTEAQQGVIVGLTNDLSGQFELTISDITGKHGF